MSHLLVTESHEEGFVCIVSNQLQAETNGRNHNLFTPQFIFLTFKILKNIKIYKKNNFNYE